MDPTRRDLPASLVGGLVPAGPATTDSKELLRLVQALQARLIALSEQVSWLSRTTTPVGAVVAFAGPWLPRRADGTTWTEAELGWLLCDGRPWMHPSLRGIPDFELKELRAALGKETLPDFRGYFLRGVDPSPFRGPANRDIQRSDSTKSWVGSDQDDSTRLPRDTKNPFRTGGDGDGHHHHAQDTDGVKHRLAICNGERTFANGTNDKQQKPYDEINMQHAAEIGLGGHSHSVLTGGDVETRPKNIAVHWVVKFK